MLFALVDKKKTRAFPSGRAICPNCGKELLAKTGEIVTWHWSHFADHDCDPWNEGESEWHLGWKTKATEDRCEVVMGNHRADIVSPCGHVIELQHSSLTPEQVRKREEHYGKMVWMIDGSEFRDRLEFWKHDTYWTFKWSHVRKWMLEIHKPMMWDLGTVLGSDDLFVVKKLYPNTPGENAVFIDGKFSYSEGSRRAGGWGRFVSRKEFDLWAFGPMADGKIVRQLSLFPEPEVVHIPPWYL